MLIPFLESASTCVSFSLLSLVPPLMKTFAHIKASPIPPLEKPALLMALQKMIMSGASAMCHWAGLTHNTGKLISMFPPLCHWLCCRSVLLGHFLDPARCPGPRRGLAGSSSWQVGYTLGIFKGFVKGTSMGTNITTYLVSVPGYMYLKVTCLCTLTLDTSAFGLRTSNIMNSKSLTMITWSLLNKLQNRSSFACIHPLTCTLSSHILYWILPFILANHLDLCNWTVFYHSVCPLNPWPLVGILMLPSCLLLKS